jgi:hypothetical protein
MIQKLLVTITNRYSPTRLVDANLVIAFFLNWSWVAFRGQLSGFTAPQLAQKILFRLKRPANELPRVGNDSSRCPYRDGSRSRQRFQNVHHLNR